MTKEERMVEIDMDFDQDTYRKLLVLSATNNQAFDEYIRDILKCSSKEELERVANEYNEQRKTDYK